MAVPSSERLSEALKIIFDENIDATETSLPETIEPRLGIGSVGKSKAVKSTKGKLKPSQQKRCSSVSNELLEDICDDIFSSALLKKDNDQPVDVKSTETDVEQLSVDPDKSGICAEMKRNASVIMDVKTSEEENRQNACAENDHLGASISGVNSTSSCVVHDTDGSHNNCFEPKNSDLSLHAAAEDMSVFGNEKVHFNCSSKIPEQDLPKRVKQFERTSKACTSMSVPPDDVVIEAMKLIFDENVDATRIFAIEKKVPTKLSTSSCVEDRESGRVKIKVKQKKYWSVLDDLLDNDSDDIFGPECSKQTKIAFPAEMKVKECQLAAEEFSRNCLECVPEYAENNRDKTPEHIVDINCDSAEINLIRKLESDATLDSTSSVVLPQKKLQIKDLENVVDKKLNLSTVEQISNDEPDVASDCDATLKAPFSSIPAESKVIFSDELPANKKVKEIPLLKCKQMRSNLPTSSQNKRKNNDISNSHKVLGVISSSPVSDKEDANSCKKRKQTLESELMRNGHTEAEIVLTNIPHFNFADHLEMNQTFVGCQKNVEKTTEDQGKEAFVHFRRTMPSKSKPCEAVFKFDDNEIEALFGSRKNNTVPSVTIRPDRDAAKQTTETMNSVKDSDLLRMSDPLLNSDSSDTAETLLNTDSVRKRKLSKSKNLHEDPFLTNSEVLVSEYVESYSESVQDAKSGIECSLQQTSLKSGQDDTCSFIFWLSTQFLSKVFPLCAIGILLVTVPSLLFLLPVYILALFNALCLIGILMVGVMIRMSFHEKKQAKNINLHATDVKHLPEIKYFKAPDDVFKGWMNELNGSYDVSNFHISHLRSVYVSLDGCTLRLQIPKKRIPKRAIYSDGLPTPGAFVKQCFYDLSGSKVTTLPEGLVLRRLWSKKYPIAIEIRAGRANKENQGIHQTGACGVGQEVERLNEYSLTHLFLFARTCREKEEWFRRFLAAASGSPLSSCPDSLIKHIPLETSNRPNLSETKTDTPSDLEFPEQLVMSDDQNFSHYLSSMSKVLSLNNESICDPQLLWLNAFISRCTMDVLQEDHWIDVIKTKLEKKLLMAKIPYFMDDVKLVEFDFGKEVPLICRATFPSLDDQGLWLDLEVIYKGRLRFTIETKCNLLKLKGMSSKDMPRVCKSSAATNSDEEDSGESSTGDSSDNEDYNDLERKKPRVNWLLGLANRITSSRYFQNAMKIERIKTVMENVSSKSLMLSVELLGFKGTMAVNIPPPPTDRIWYGFRHMPDLEMSVEIQVGQRQITLTPLTNWIEKKLIVELERALVMPNMDDIIFPIMCDHVTNAHVPSAGNSE